MLRKYSKKTSCTKLAVLSLLGHMRLPLKLLCLDIVYIIFVTVDKRCK